jgi:hypothetical protein
MAIDEVKRELVDTQMVSKRDHSSARLAMTDHSVTGSRMVHTFLLKSHLTKI